MLRQNADTTVVEKLEEASVSSNKQIIIVSLIAYTKLKKVGRQAKVAANL